MFIVVVVTKIAHIILVYDIFELDFTIEVNVARRDNNHAHDILYFTILTQEGVPVCLYAAKALSLTDESYGEADKGMREELERLRQRTVLPEVYAISAVECSLRFYKVEKASGLVSTFVEVDIAEKSMRDNWKTDLLSQDGHGDCDACRGTSHGIVLALCSCM